MKTFLSPHLLPRRRLRWPEVLAGVLFIMPILAIGLQLSILHISPLWVMCLDVSVFAGCALIFGAGIAHSKGRFRWSTICCTASMIGSALIQLLAIAIVGGLLTYDQASVIQGNLLVLAYILGMFAIALSFPHRLLMLGNAWHVILNSIIVSAAALIILQSTFPAITTALREVFVPEWNPTYETQSMVAFIAFDIGLLFGFSVFCMRLGRPISPLFPLLSLSILCLTIGDIVYFVVSGAFPREFANLDAIPIYMVRRILWALGMYWHVTVAEPNPEVLIETHEMTYKEWFAWTRFAPVVTLVALACATLLAPAPSDALIILLGFAVIRELATHQEYRLMQLLKRSKDDANAAHAQAEETNRKLRAFMTQAEDLAVEQERNRVAREIHDGLGHHLNNAKVYVEVAHRYIDRDHAMTLDALTTAKAEVRNSQQELRRAIEALVSDDYLAGSLEDLLAGPVRDCQLSGISTTLHVVGTSRSLPEQIKHTLYRIGQEALRNISQHSQAKSASLTIDYGDQCVRMMVEDDGVGIPPTVKRRRGHGLDNLQERAELIGGTTDIQTRLGQGVRIVVEVPSG